MGKKLYKIINKKKDLLNNPTINLRIGPTEKQIIEKMEKFQKTLSKGKNKKNKR